MARVSLHYAIRQGLSPGKRQVVVSTTVVTGPAGMLHGKDNSSAISNCVGAVCAGAMRGIELTDRRRIETVRKYFAC